MQGTLPSDAASAAVRSRVAADYPAVNSPATSDFVKTNLIRQWAYANSDMSDEARLISTDGRTLADVLDDFDNDRGGVWCGGTAWFLMRVYGAFGFESGRVGFGLGGASSGFTHVVTLVNVSDHGVTKTIVQDAYENCTFVDRGQSPLDVGQIVAYLGQNRDGEVVVRNGPPLARDLLVGTPTARQLWFAPAIANALHWPDGVKRPFQQVGPDTWKTRSVMNNWSVETEYYQPLCRGGFLGDGHPDRSVYAFLYAMWGDGELGREFLDRFGTTDEVMPPFHWLDGGLKTPADINTRTPFTVQRSFQVLADSPPFSLAYYASVDGILGNGDDYLLARETIRQTGAGSYTDRSPALTLPRAGAQRIFVVREPQGATGHEVPVAVKSPVVVTGPTDVTIDNGDVNYRQRGDWRPVSRSGRLGHDFAYTGPGTGSKQAAWRVGGLPAGTYEVRVTWSAGENRATNAPYRIYDGGTLVATVRVDQTVAPRPDSHLKNTAFQTLGLFRVRSGALRVVLGDDANGHVIADAVRVVTWSPPVSDLSGLSLDSPSGQAVATGSPLTVAYSYRVSGEALKESFTVAYYASRDDVFGNADDSRVAQEMVSVADDETAGDHSGTSPPLTLREPGDYFLFAVADHNGRIFETDEANNVVALSAPLRVG